MTLSKDKHQNTKNTIYKKTSKDIKANKYIQTLLNIYATLDLREADIQTRCTDLEM